MCGVVHLLHAKVAAASQDVKAGTVGTKAGRGGSPVLGGQPMPPERAESLDDETDRIRSELHDDDDAAATPLHNPLPKPRATPLTMPVATPLAMPRARPRFRLELAPAHSSQRTTFEADSDKEGKDLP